MIRNKTAYAYIVARTKVMKSRLLKAEDFRKLLNMSLDEVTRFLEELEYKKEIDEYAYKYSGPRLLDYALYANLARTYKKILQVSFGEARELLSEYFKRWDVWNIINILRGKTAKIEQSRIEETLIPAGELNQDHLKALLTKDIEEIVKELEATPYGEVVLKIASTPMNVVEDELYKLYYKRLISIQAKDFETNLFLNFIRMEIDVRNLKTILRLKAEDISAEDILNKIIPGGYELTEDEIRKLVTLSFEEFVKSLENYWFREVTGKISRSLSLAEVSIDRAWIRAVAKRASNYPLSILPVLQYIVLKKVEVDNIRIIAWGKWLNMPTEEIESQLVIV
ncbi:MAG: V-type ATP synthase subunit C [Archaeoglobaceae archaeon]|nr:V-type ATP synthase subunit C [Archaeoglobaceae archaeon]MDW8013809.1 V-type ATP synthase subunit C [Archaeoglobaceae archaeon]